MTDFLPFVISGIVLLILPILLFGVVWLRGFFFPFLRVKASGGGKVLVKVRGKLRDEFVVGTIYEGALRFKLNKDGRTLNCPDDSFVYRAYNVYCVDVDEEKNAIYTLNAEAVSGYDAVKYDNLLTRALMKPQEQTKVMLIVIILLIVIMLVVLGEAAMLYQLYQKVDAVGSVGTVTGGL